MPGGNSNPLWAMTVRAPGQALTYIQQLYAIEQKARDGHLAPSQRKQLRLEEVPAHYQ